MPRLPSCRHSRTRRSQHLRRGARRPPGRSIRSRPLGGRGTQASRRGVEARALCRWRFRLAGRHRPDAGNRARSRPTQEQNRNHRFMKNVGSKPETLRNAVATAVFQAPKHCLELVASGKSEKGDPAATARVAGILAAKRTDEILPLCHPLPLHSAEVYFDVRDNDVLITAEVATIGPTGVEMEALTAASVAAL